MQKLEAHSHSIYFSGFPDDWIDRDVKGVLRKFGSVIDVFIPIKRNKFAFVRFDRKDPLDEIIAGI